MSNNKKKQFSVVNNNTIIFNYGEHAEIILKNIIITTESK